IADRLQPALNIEKALLPRSLHPPITACGHRVRFVGTWREEFFEAPKQDVMMKIRERLEWRDRAGNIRLGSRTRPKHRVWAMSALSHNAKTRIANRQATIAGCTPTQRLQHRSSTMTHQPANKWVPSKGGD